MVDVVAVDGPTVGRLASSTFVDPERVELDVGRAKDIITQLLARDLDSLASDLGWEKPEAPLGMAVDGVELGGDSSGVAMVALTQDGNITSLIGVESDIITTK